VQGFRLTPEENRDTSHIFLAPKILLEKRPVIAGSDPQSPDAEYNLLDSHFIYLFIYFIS
jgi:hypothetical protein